MTCPAPIAILRRLLRRIGASLFLLVFVACGGERAHDEQPPVAPSPPPSPGMLATSPAREWTRDGYTSVQVNVVDVDGVPHNVEGDAANEPSICVDPGAPLRMSVGWRQFDTLESDFRQAGWATSHDGGATWPYGGTLTPAAFSTDPVLVSDLGGRFYYAGVGAEYLRLFRSLDAGLSWEGPLTVAAGFHDKAWMAVDRANGHIYLAWSDPRHFTRSTDGGDTFLPPMATPLDNELVSMIALDPDGTVYLADKLHQIARSLDSREPGVTPIFELMGTADLGGDMIGGAGPNPNGLLGQTSLAVDSSAGPGRGNLYILASVRPWQGVDPLDVMFARSTDGGRTWSPPVRVNDDPVPNAAWQWLATMSVAPTGRIDAIWADTRSSGVPRISELYYSFSIDEGRTWSANVAVSSPFDSWLGWPQQRRLGDYYHSVSDETGVDVVYAATFNGEQDVYYLRIGARQR